MDSATEARLRALRERMTSMWRYLDLESKEKKVALLEKEMAGDAFWDDQEAAQKVIAESNGLKNWILPYREIDRGLCDIEDLFPEAESIGDVELVQELLLSLDDLEKRLADLEVRKMLGGELDDKDCYLEVNAGAGGTESCDWAEMLSRMYQRYATRKGWKVELVDRLEGDVAGVKSVTFRFSGPFAYGYCKSEKGVHRLVRISPFDSNARRHTSFVSVDVTPIIEAVRVEVRTEDIKVDTYRASGAGGQHVNKTDSAVRITHLPTGIVVSCQSERSQIQNRETCMQMLRSKLYEREVLARQEKLSQMGGEKREISWGSQIRNYVFQPYTLVKDTRTKVEVGNITAVMDGEIDEFVQTYLKMFG
ncbi:MAG: peptide chain release factor 2 [Verrucomicrobiota bacterium]|nr:peptide chain release factor 2 [Verrucomicrobiota bacterium]